MLLYDDKWSPYILFGFRGDYMLSYKDIEVIEQGSGIKFKMYESQIDQFNKFNLGALLGLGLEIKHMYYMEVEYNPAITNSFNSEGLKIMDNCWSMKLGININKFFKHE
jgi:hypothetical protein